jgi:putative ABC transport system permease protein
VPKNNNFTSRAAAYILADAYDRWFGRSQPLNDASYQMWVPVKGATALSHAVVKAMGRELTNVSFGTERMDYRSKGNDKAIKKFRYVAGGIGGLILLLGAMSLLNIALVTIKQRIREIGIRRSFGATTGRVFFSVMMESVVATFVAGIVGVIGAVGIVNSSFITKHVIKGVTDVPPFPISAAVIGLLVSLGVGALAGLLPALIAVRVKIIDAIRF